ncbi:MAG: metallophosphoesterase family protein [Pseudomonadota bacterium]
MQFAVISDIHGNTAALVAVLAALDRAGVSDIINLGDSLSGPFDPAGTADLLIDRNIPSIRGNHDRMLLDPADQLGLWEQWSVPDLTPMHFDWLKSLPETMRRGDLLAIHASPGNDEENWLDHRGKDMRIASRDRAGIEARAGDIDAALVLAGHTHTPRMVRLPGGPVIVNPGAVGCPGYLDDRSDPPFIHETGAPDARYAVIDMDEGRIDVALCSTPYDPTAMAALARAKGADTWAQAIETGWFTPPASE